MRKLIYKVTDYNGNEIARTTDFDIMKDFERKGYLISTFFERLVQEKEETEQDRNFKAKLAKRVEKIRGTA